MVQRRLVGELGCRHGGDHFAVVFDHHHSVVGHLAHFGPRQIPLIENPLHLFLAPLVHDDEHALLRFAQQNLVRRHVGCALRHLGQIDLDAGTAAGRCLAGGAGQAGCAHVLYSRDRAGRQQLEAGFHAEFLHERIAHLHSAALLLGRFLGQILRRKRRAGQAVAPGRRADVKHRVAHALGRPACHLAVAQHPEAEGVNERISFIRGVKIDFSGHRREADAVTVMGDAGHHAAKQPSHGW